MTDAIALQPDQVERASLAAVPAWKNEYGESIDPITHVNRRDFVSATPDPLELKRVLRIGAQQTRWMIEVSCGGVLYEVRLGTTPDFTTRRKFRQRIFEATGSWLPSTIKGPEWDLLTSALHAASILQDHDSTDADQTRAWIAGYLENVGDGEIFDIDDSVDRARALGAKDLEGYGGWRRKCFRDQQGRLYLSLDDLLKHVTRSVARTTRGDLAAQLATLGFESKQLSARTEDKVLKGRFWRSPAAFDPEDRS